MRKEIIINASISGTRIAILEWKRLVELYIELPEQERMVGNIYKGVVENVIKGIGAAFVDIGMPQNSFLRFTDIGEFYESYGPISDENGDKEKWGKSRKTASTRWPPVVSNQEILVQITKEPIGTKGARVTSEVTLPGRFFVLVPGYEHVGVSRKIGNIREKNRLKRLSYKLRPKGVGLIVRTVAAGRKEQELQADLQSLLRTWNKIEQNVRQEKGPLPLYKDMGMVSSIIRDLFTPDVDRVVVDSRKLHKEITKYLRDVSPDLHKKVEYYNGMNPIFDEYKIERDVEKCFSRRVWLKSGGYIIFDQTEALVAIDVNSGKHVSRGEHDETSLKINLEACQEIARQLRLRDLGGLIVIDFIDMIDPARKKTLINEFRRQLRKDRAKTSISDLSNFGLIEMTRERTRPSLIYSFTETCATCDGLGNLPSSPTVVTKIEHAIRRLRARSKERRIKLIVHPELESYLQNGVWNRLRKIMVKYLVKIQLSGDTNMPYGEFKMLSRKSDDDLAEIIKT
jgi:ribonuclease G